jgi:hypothetical protein
MEAPASQKKTLPPPSGKGWGVRLDPSKLAFAFPFTISNGGDAKELQGPPLKDNCSPKTN